MSVLIIFQNEYGYLKGNSKFEMIGVENIRSCVAVALYSPSTQERLMVHLDGMGSQEQVIEFMLGFPEDLRVTLITNPDYSQGCAKMLKENLAQFHIVFDERYTLTKTVIMQRDGEIRTDYLLKYDLSTSQWALGLANPTRSHQWVRQPLEICRAAYGILQDIITNFNNFSRDEEIKTLHTALLPDEQLSGEPELLDLKIIQFLEKARDEITRRQNNQRVCRSLSHTEEDNLERFIAQLAWRELGKPRTTNKHGYFYNKMNENKKEIQRFFFLKKILILIPEIEKFKARHLHQAQGGDLPLNMPFNNLDSYNASTWKMGV